MLARCEVLRFVKPSVKQHGSWCVFRAVLPRRTRIFNLIEKLLNRISALKPRLFHATDFRVIPFSYTLAKFTTLKCSSLINTTPKAPKYLSFDSMPKKQFCRCSLYVDVSNYTTSLATPRRYHRDEKSLLPVTRQSIVFKTKQGLLFTNLFQVLVNHWMTVCLSTNLKF